MHFSKEWAEIINKVNWLIKAVDIRIAWFLSRSFILSGPSKIQILVMKVNIQDELSKASGLFNQMVGSTHLCIFDIKWTLVAGMSYQLNYSAN